MPNPKVFFDITADGAELGRIVMEVSLSGYRSGIANSIILFSYVLMLSQRLLKTFVPSALVKREMVGA